VAVHNYTQTIHRTTHIKIHRTTQIAGEEKNVESAGRAPSKNASFTLEFALKMRKKHGKTSVRDRCIIINIIYIYNYTFLYHTVRLRGLYKRK
jgi:hypothetical protein